MKHLPVVQLDMMREKGDMREAVERELRERVEVWLKRFKLDSAQTLTTMEVTGSVLSGSAALEIAVPGSCVPNDLDFYCPRSIVRAMMYFLQELQGYVDVTTGKDSRRYGEHITGIRSVRTLQHKDDSALTINVIESSTRSAHAPILLFHSTVVMNFVSSKGIGMFYPTLTTKGIGKRRNSLMIGERMIDLKFTGLVNRVYRHMNAQCIAGVLKYMRRGFVMHDLCVDHHGNDHSGRHECHHKVRCIGDGSMSTVSFVEGGAVEVTPVIRWCLGIPGRRAVVHVKKTGGWHYISADT